MLQKDSCKEAKDLLFVFFENGSQDSKNNFEKHISACINCKENLTEYQNIISVLNGIKRVEKINTSGNFMSDLQIRINKEKENKSLFFDFGKLFNFQAFSMSFAIMIIMFFALQPLMQNNLSFQNEKISYRTNSNRNLHITEYMKKMPVNDSINEKVTFFLMNMSINSNDEKIGNELKKIQLANLNSVKSRQYMQK